MGGDVAVALAGIDKRITRAAALVATPDWTRGGMRALGEPVVLDQGEADRYAKWFYDAFDPITHLDSYRRDLTIKFFCGGSDQHVPTEAALRLQGSLGERVKVQLLDGLDHLDAAQDGRLYSAGCEWLAP